MAYVECGKGHVYDAAEYGQCPYCNGGSNRIDFDMGSATGRTVNGAEFPEEEIGATVAPQMYGAKKEEKEEDIGKTVGVLQKSMQLEPVVGWLVCIDGKEKGKDYKIYARNNTIGRSEKMDICIKEDATISRENHARLGYDEKHNGYYLIPSEAINNIYINEEPVYVPTKLTPYDMLEFGETKLLFVPFCCEKFNWKDGLKQGE